MKRKSQQSPLAIEKRIRLEHPMVIELKHEYIPELKQRAKQIKLSESIKELEQVIKRRSEIKHDDTEMELTITSIHPYIYAEICELPRFRGEGHKLWDHIERLTKIRCDASDEDHKLQKRETQLRQDVVNAKWSRLVRNNFRQNTLKVMLKLARLRWDESCLKLTPKGVYVYHKDKKKYRIDKYGNTFKPYGRRTLFNISLIPPCYWFCDWYCPYDMKNRIPDWCARDGSIIFN